MSNQLQKIGQLYHQTEGVVNGHRIVQDILNDASIPMSSKDNAIIAGALKGQIASSDLKLYLLSKSDKKATVFNKLLIVYDYLEYCPSDKRISFA